MKIALFITCLADALFSDVVRATVTVLQKWGKPYPAIGKLWCSAWTEFVPFLDYATSRSAGSSAPRTQSRA